MLTPYLLPAVTGTKKRGGGALSPWWPVPREWHPNDLWLVRSPFIPLARRDRYSLMAGHPGNRFSSVAIPRGCWTLSFESNNFSPLHQSRTWFSFAAFPSPSSGPSTRTSYFIRNKVFLVFIASTGQISIILVDQRYAIYTTLIIHSEKWIKTNLVNNTLISDLI